MRDVIKKLKAVWQSFQTTQSTEKKEHFNQCLIEMRACIVGLLNVGEGDPVRSLAFRNICFRNIW